MLENLRLSICGFYMVFDSASELFDFAMCWYERRMPLYELMIEYSYSKEDKTAVPQDENGRELP